MTQGFLPAARRPAPVVATADIVIEAPPGLPPPASPSPLRRLLPVVMSVATLGVVAAAFFSGSAVTRGPTVLALPTMMLASTAMTVVAGRGRRGGDIDTDRDNYLGYLGRVRDTVTETAVVQRASLNWNHPDPDQLWTLIGGPRMWERRATDPDFGLVRIGIGVQPLATRLVAPETVSAQPSDPVTTTALRRFLDAHSTIADAPITIGLTGIARMTIDGDATAARGLLRAMICQLAVSHAPDQLLLAAAVGGRNRTHWDWLKWLPHNQDPTQSPHGLGGAEPPHVVVIADRDGWGDFGGAGASANTTVLEVGTGGDGMPLTIRRAGDAQAVGCPDRMDPLDALVCARRLAAYRVTAVAGIDLITLWGSQNHSDRLRVPLGITAAGATLELDIKEPAEGGIGPHGLCVGATGSGKSELLRTVALGMMARNSPDVLNLLLIDFKGGATFLDFARAPHVAAVVTNLADEGPLVARMQDALGGEMNRRQRVLRTAGCASVAAYDRMRATNDQWSALPTLFIIVDEFSELLSQQPDFADVFMAIGRLGRSLGMHLLLASQRLDEGRLRGLEAHLSYRICLKTLSANESRTVLGTPDAYQLPNTPGAGFLRSGGDELARFQAAFVSGPMPVSTPSTVAATSVRPFTTRAAGPLTRAAATSATPTVLHAVLDRLSGQGPPAHQVWLPPLGPAPALNTLLGDAVSAPPGLTVPIGIVDRPFEQRRTPLTVDLSGAAGNVAVVGSPQSGKSTALRTLITALAATHDPGHVQFYCLDFGGGALASVSGLPHVGAVAGRAEPRLVDRIVAECESVVRSREVIFGDHGIGSIAEYRRLRAQRAVPDGDPFGDVFLVVDGWATVRQEFEALETSITALAAQGLSFGVHVMLSASRWAEIRPSLKDQIGTRIELRLGDPADSDVDRKRAQQVPHDRPGRGISSDGLHMVIALPRAEIPHGAAVAPPIALLPNQIDRDTVVGRASAELGTRILLGLEERRLQPVAVDFEHHPHLLILGDNDCGKTATLRTLGREIIRTKTAAQARLLIVDFRRSLLGALESEHLGGHAMSPAALSSLLPDLLDLLRQRMPPAEATRAQLQARSWWSGPDIYVLVDDYELVAAPGGNPLAALLEYVPHAWDLGLHLVVARRSGGAERALFEPLLAGLRDHDCLELMMSGCPDPAAPFGSARPTRLPPGRGVLVTCVGDEQLVQVAWSPP